MKNPTFNDCDSLLQFMCKNYKEPYTGYAEFEGHKIEFDFSYWDPDLYIVSPKFPGVLFLLSTQVFEEGTIGLGILIGEGTLDGFPCVELPAYIKNALVAACHY